MYIISIREKDIMKGIFVILTKEWRCFVSSSRGNFLIYVILIVSWSIMLFSSGHTPIQTGPLWLIFFSVVISANFSNTVFIAERVNGILEILLTSGLSRGHILYGKMIFVGAMSVIIGIICAAISTLWKFLFYHDAAGLLSADMFILYVTSVFMNTASSAYLSVRMKNPRLLHFSNLLLLAFIMGMYSAASYFFEIPSYTLAVVFIIIGAAATAGACRLYESEKIIQPVAL